MPIPTHGGAARPALLLGLALMALAPLGSGCAAAPPAAERIEPATPPAAATDSAASDAALGRKLAAVRTELDLAGGDLHVVNLYKLEATVLRETAGRDTAEVLDRLAREVYRPYAAFWNGYLGDEREFREWAAGKLLAADHPVRTRLPALLDVGLDRVYTRSAAWIARETGRRPQGTWYVVFGPGWTDMGGLGDIGMVADFTRMVPDRAAIEFILPHELTHEVHGPSPARRGDPDRGTVLERIVAEGFASYVSWVYAGGRASPARALMYSEDEWRAALAHEPQLIAVARRYLGSRERGHVDAFASRNDHPVAGAPAAAGYFLGFRIVQAYVERRGKDSWREIYDLPVAEVVARSGYPLGAGQ